MLFLKCEGHGGALTEMFGARTEHLDILLKRMVSQICFPSDLPVFPNSSSMHAPRI
jgi:hypothetical protein